MVQYMLLWSTGMVKYSVCVRVCAFPFRKHQLQMVYYPHECSDINIRKVIRFHVERPASGDLALGIHITECRVLFP